MKSKWLKTAQTPRDEKIKELTGKLREILEGYRNVKVTDDDGKQIIGWLESSFLEKYKKSSTDVSVSDVIDKTVSPIANTYMNSIKWMSGGQWVKEDMDKVKDEFKKYLEWYSTNNPLPPRKTPEEIKRKKEVDKILGVLFTEDVMEKLKEEKGKGLDDLFDEMKKKFKSETWFKMSSLTKDDVIKTIRDIFGPDVLTNEIHNLVDKADSTFDREYNLLVFDPTLTESRIKKQLYEIADQVANDVTNQFNETVQKELGRTFPTLHNRVYNAVKSYLEGKIEKKLGSKSKWLK